MISIALWIPNLEAPIEIQSILSSLQTTNIRSGRYGEMSKQCSWAGQPCGTWLEIRPYHQVLFLFILDSYFWELFQVGQAQAN